MHVTKYYCDRCKKEVKDIWNIEYDFPGDIIYRYGYDLCADCVKFIHSQINCDINETPCDAFVSSE